MAEEGINIGLDTNNASLAQALMEEDLEREIARNRAANDMAREREAQAAAARKRAEESQRMMKDMMQKYEDMRVKLEFTKKHLDDTNNKIEVQEGLTEKIRKMKERVEQYSDKREAVSCLNEAVFLKAQVVAEQENERALAEPEESDKGEVAQPAVSETRLKMLKQHMQENEERLKKREELKVWLEEQVNKGEKRAAEQSRIAKAKEDLLALRLRELKLQTQRLERRKEQQKRAELNNEDFLNLIDKDLEEMEARTCHKENRERELEQLTEQREKLEKARTMKLELAEAKAKTKKLEAALKEKRERMGREKEEKSVDEDRETGAIPKQKKTTPKVMSPVPADSEQAKLKSPQPSAKSCSPVPAKSCSPVPTDSHISSPACSTAQSTEAPSEASSTSTAETAKAERAVSVTDLEDDSMTEESAEKRNGDLNDVVKKIEGKCASVKGDLAEMAMSEQYLRTKQAMLLAKKKEREMSVAENIANLREAEVEKMREKVKHMQELLAQRREKLKIQEEMMKEKSAQKEKIDKIIEAKKRRGNYCEKELVERIIFEKEPPKKK